MAHFTQASRGLILDNDEAGVFLKSARIIAVQINEPFTVQTDRGVMTGEPGDWLVTNHPNDDPGSDVWSISDARMQSTYAPATPAE